MNGSTFVHPTAEVHADARIGEGAMIWNWTKVREGARVGRGTTLGQCVYVDEDVHIGEGCKVQNGVSLYRGLWIADEVLIGPNATFTNDLVPRAHNRDWQVVPTRVEEGASIGANATIVCGVTLGAHCLVGAGAVVTRDVPPHAVVTGSPARVVGFITREGHRMEGGPDGRAAASLSPEPRQGEGS